MVFFAARLINSFAMKYGVHLWRRWQLSRVPASPCRLKFFGSLALAVEAGSVPRTKSGGFIEKEELGPATARHHIAPYIPELANAYDPCTRRPPLFQESFPSGVMDNAAVSHHRAALCYGNDVAEGRDTILQGHLAASGHGVLVLFGIIVNTHQGRHARSCCSELS